MLRTSLFLRIGLLYFLLPVYGQAQWRGLQFDQFQSRDGLNSDDIRAICQDSTGYMYFGGYQQLIRYDGRAFEDFTHDPDDSTSIGPGQISQMLLARDGKICITMRRDGLNIYDPISESFSRHEAPVPENLLDPIVEDEEGQLWLGGDNFNLLKFNRDSALFSIYRPPADLVNGRAAITGIIQDLHNQDILWVSTYNYQTTGESAFQMFQFDRRSETFSKQPCVGNLKIQDDKGRLWSGSWDTGLWRYDPQTTQCENMRFQIQVETGIQPGDGVFEIYPVNGAKWVGSRNSMLSVSEDLTHAFLIKDQSLGGVTAFHTDRSGNTWIGASNGLRVYHPASQHIAFFELSMFGSSERIYPGRLAYHAGENTIYLINRTDQCLYRIPLDRDRNAEFIPMPFNLSAVAVDEKGRLFVAGDSVLHRFHPDTRKLESIYSVLPNGDRIPWLWSMESRGDGLIVGIGTNDVFWFRDDGATFGHLVHESESPVQMAHSRVFLAKDNSALISGGSQMYHVSPDSGVERRIRSKEQGHLVQDHEGFYWIGTINSIGRYRMTGDSMELVRYFTAKDGLTNITASHLHVDVHGRIWIFSSSGMSVIDPATYQTRNVGVPEGLPISSIDPVQVINLPDGRISTVNSNGIIIFHPDSLWHATSRSNVEVVLKKVRIKGQDADFGKHVNFLEHLALVSDQNTLDVQFQALAFPNDRHITYSYRVDGLHTNWNWLESNNTVTLSGLPPGDYVFRVKAGAPDSGAPTKLLSFTIATPVYLQTWFLLLCALLLCGTIVMIYRYRVAQIRRQEEEKMKTHRQIAELELQALRSQMNPHFMFNSLNSIKNYILKHETTKAAEYLSSFAHLIRLILQHSREKTIPLKDELETLLLYIDLEKLRFRDGFEFICQVDESIDTMQVQIPPMIIQPYIENAIWHGLLHKESDRCLSLRITKYNGTVTCEVEDNGIGRTQATEIKSKSATRYKSMGMGITQDRITIMNSMNALGIRIDVIDKTNGTGPSGTLVKIQIPHAHHTD